MASSGLYSIPEFQGRNVLRLAPDAFIAVNTEVGMRVVSPVGTDSNSNGYRSLDVRGGITSINISAAIHPPGSSRANIDIIAPIYKGLHEDYYYTLPNGTRKFVLQPMMEVKVFFKGLKLKNGNPVYYPVFWGFISSISENYSGGVYNFSLVCSDMLSWWKYQKLTLIPANESSAIAGRLTPYKFPTLFLDMNPWQIIYNLFYQTDWLDEEGNRYDFIYPKLSKLDSAPDFGHLLNGDEEVERYFFQTANNANSYWQRRFGTGRTSPADNSDRMQLEMFGLLNSLDLNNREIVSALSFDERIETYQDRFNVQDLDINFYLLSYVQPYGAHNVYNSGSEALEHTKLEIATEVCEQTEMEFFLDTNGSVVFKPPFYNLDVTNSDVDTYVIKAKDVINFSGDVNTDAICTYLEAYSPRFQFDPDLDSTATHIDQDLLRKFGLRYQKVDVRYGVDENQLRLIAAAKMARINGAAFTGSVSIPMRPEIRLGYPVYLSHIDAYYYVTGISHSFSFGSSATTTLSLEYRRDRVFSDGSVEGTSPGDVLKGYVYRYGAGDAASTPNFAGYLKKDPITADQKIEKYEEEIKKAGGTPLQKSLLDNEVKKWENLRGGGVISGPNTSGIYGISKAKVSFAPVSSPKTNAKEAVISNELIMISFPISFDNNGKVDSTEETFPYTDINGYRHIGGFPYGANLALLDNGSRMGVYSNPVEQNKQSANKQNASPNSSSDSSKRSGDVNQNPADGSNLNVVGNTDVSSVTYGTDDPELAVKLYNDKVSGYTATQDQITAKNRPSNSSVPKSPLSANNTGNATDKQADLMSNAGVE